MILRSRVKSIIKMLKVFSISKALPGSGHPSKLDGRTRRKVVRKATI